MNALLTNNTQKSEHFIEFEQYFFKKCGFSIYENVYGIKKAVATVYIEFCAWKWFQHSTDVFVLSNIQEFEQITEFKTIFPISKKIYGECLENEINIKLLGIETLSKKDFLCSNPNYKFNENDTSKQVKLIKVFSSIDIDDTDLILKTTNFWKSKEFIWRDKEWKEINKGEVFKLLEMSYDECCDYLQEKYGVPVHNYFVGDGYKSKDQRNRRSHIGLLIYHRDSNKANDLTNPSTAATHPKSYQKNDRLVYCDMLERLVLRLKTIEYSTKGIEAFIGYRGFLDFNLAGDDLQKMNDVFSGYRYSYLEPLKNRPNDNQCFSLIKERYDEFLACIEYAIINPKIYINNFFSWFFMTNWESFFNGFVFFDIVDLIKKHEKIIDEKFARYSKIHREIWDENYFSKLRKYLIKNNIENSEIEQIKSIFLHLYENEYLKKINNLNPKIDFEKYIEEKEKFLDFFRSKVIDEIRNSFNINIDKTADIFVELGGFFPKRKMKEFSKDWDDWVFDILWDEMTDDSRISYSLFYSEFDDVKKNIKEYKKKIFSKEMSEVFSLINNKENEFENLYLWNIFENAHLFNQVLLTTGNEQVRIIVENSRMCKYFSQKYEMAFSMLKICAFYTNYYASESENFLAERIKSKKLNSEQTTLIQKTFNDFKKINYINDILIDIELMKKRGLSVWMKKEQIEALINNAKQSKKENNIETQVPKGLKIKEVSFKEISFDVLDEKNITFNIIAEEDKEYNINFDYKDVVDMLYFVRDRINEFNDFLFYNFEEQNQDNAQIIQKILLNKKNNLLLYIFFVNVDKSKNDDFLNEETVLYESAYLDNPNKEREEILYPISYAYNVDVLNEDDEE